MKNIIILLSGCSLAIAMSAGFAAGSPDKMNTKMKWNCTTNASAATTDAQKATDEKMTKSMKSAKSAFAAAVANCRDCTKITCDAK